MKIKYTSDYSTQELIDGGYIEKFILPIVILLTKIGINTVGSCEGHINNFGNCEYPWVDFIIDDLNKFINILNLYNDRPEILIQLRNDSFVVDKGSIVRIFPYCKNLVDGRRIFKKLEKYLLKI
jgi:hypothetical protein